MSIGDIWDPGAETFISWTVAQAAFGLLPTKCNMYQRIIAAIPLDWRHMLTIAKHNTSPKEFLGLFNDPSDLIPSIIIQRHKSFRPQLSGVITELTIPVEQPSYEVGLPSMLMRQRKTPAHGNEEFWGLLQRVRVT